MARSRNAGKTPAKAVELPPQAPESETDEGAGDFPEALRIINQLAGSGGTIEWDIRVYKVPGGMGRGATNRQQFLFKVDLEDLPELESTLANDFPEGGIFRVMVRADGRQIKFVTLDISSRPGYKAPAPAWRSAIATPTENPPTDKIEMLLIRMAENQQQFQQAIVQALAAKPSSNGLTEQVQLLTQLQGLLPKAQQESSLEMFQKGMDFAQKIYEAADKGGGNSSFLDLARDFVSSPAMASVGEAIKKQIENMPKPAAPAAPAPAAIAGPQVENPFAPNGAFVHPNNPAALNVIETLIGQAQSGADPALTAGAVLSQLPENVLSELEAQDDIFAYIAARFPQVIPFKSWFDVLLANMFIPEETPAPQEHGQGNGSVAGAGAGGA